MGSNVKCIDKWKLVIQQAPASLGSRGQYKVAMHNSIFLAPPLHPSPPPLSRSPSFLPFHPSSLLLHPSPLSPAAAVIGTSSTLAHLPLGHAATISGVDGGFADLLVKQLKPTLKGHTAKEAEEEEEEEEEVAGEEGGGRNRTKGRKQVEGLQTRAQLNRCVRACA